MKKAFRVLLQYFFFAALAAFFVWLSVKDMDHAKWLQLKDALHRANYWILAPVLLVLLASHYLRALRWRQLIEPLGYRPSIMNTFLGVIIGYFVNLGAPRLGEVIKCTILARYEKVPADKLVGTIVAERAFDVISLLIVFGLTFILQFNVINSLTTDLRNSLFHSANGQTSYLKIGLWATGAIVAFLVLRFIFTRYGHISIVQRIRMIFVNIWHGLISIRGLTNKPLFIVYSVGIWTLYYLATWLGFFAINETAHLGPADALSVLAMGSIGMIVSPGGIGAYALLVQKTVAFYDVPSIPFGLALGWLLWFGQFLSFVLFGVASFILLPRINRKKYAVTPDNTAKSI